jgi:hypothetical protein
MQFGATPIRMARFHTLFENPVDRDITLFTTLMVAKPFTTAKGKGILEAWQVAVDVLISLVNKATCWCRLVDKKPKFIINI